MSATLTATEAARPAAPTTRVSSIDLIRGAVMVLMAIDHVRVYAGVPAGGPTPALFFTRWITNFCAPAFVFLAGTSAFLYGRRHPDLSRFLVTRGLWLVFLDLTLMRLVWTFNGQFTRFLTANVIWAIGWSMVLMAVLVKLPVKAVGVLGVVIIAGHNLLDPHLRTLIPAAAGSSLSGLWKILYLGFFAGPLEFGANGPRLVVLYSLVPWVGVMAAGYAFGTVLTLDPARRNRVCLTLGLGAIAAFAVLRGFNLYGDPRPWTAALVQRPNGPPPMPAWLAVLNTSKYPASFLFLLMTLGPAIALIPLLEGARGAVARWLTVFGRVPFFFYVLHIPLIHAMALVVSRIRLGTVTPWLFENHPMGNGPPPDGYTWSLPLLYLVWAIACVLLYGASRWYARFKARRTDWWLSYL